MSSCCDCCSPNPLAGRGDSIGCACLLISTMAFSDKTSVSGFKDPVPLESAFGSTSGVDMVVESPRDVHVPDDGRLLQSPFASVHTKRDEPDHVKSPERARSVMDN